MDIYIRLVGPAGSGKTRLAAKIEKLLKAELKAGDVATCYATQTNREAAQGGGNLEFAIEKR